MINKILGKNLKSYCNPVPFSDGKNHTNPDPFVLRWCGKYYCYATDEFGVKVNVSEDLVHWDKIGYAISETEFHNYWAPSVLYQNGIFYLYYSNEPADETDCHQEHLKLATAINPEGPFTMKKTFFDKFSIDSHPILWNEELYMFYSVNDWLGTEKKVAGTCIMLDRMNSPEEFSGHPKPVILPTLPQEIYQANRFGDGRDWYTIEGACPVIREDKCWLLYSANAYENVNYFVGTAVAEKRDSFWDMKWEKYPNEFTWKPLLKKNEFVEGTGHNTVTKAPNMVDDWIVYHGRNAEDILIEGVEQRVMRIDPLYYNGNQMICFGPSYAEAEVPRNPSFQIRNLMLNSTYLLTDSRLFYHMEFWVKAQKSHTGVRYGIYLEYQDERNYLEVRICTGQNELQILSCIEGITVVLKSQPLPDKYDYTVPHLICIERRFDDYLIKSDDEKTLEIQNNYIYKQSKIGIIPYFSQLMLYSFDITEHVLLEKKKLQYLRYFYNISDSEAKAGGLISLRDEIVLQGLKEDDHYVEEFNLKVKSGKNSVSFYREGLPVIELSNIGDSFSFYHEVHGKQECFLLDGKIIPDRGITSRERKIRLEGLDILHYRYTKI